MPTTIPAGAEGAPAWLVYLTASTIPALILLLAAAVPVINAIRNKANTALNKATEAKGVVTSQQGSIDNLNSQITSVAQTAGEAKAKAETALDQQKGPNLQ